MRCLSPKSTPPPPPITLTTKTGPKVSLLMVMMTPLQDDEQVLSSVPPCGSYNQRRASCMGKQTFLASSALNLGECVGCLVDAFHFVSSRLPICFFLLFFFLFCFFFFNVLCDPLFNYSLTTTAMRRRAS